ncbi:hypothetical protein [Candidatus Ichthyocystis sparus]|uniref:hypothetical protein n=1 Tax=Candidatus Ichthyocystis sparus TaxID=1561004 RepID=UPI000B85720F|nr:hypothetical protein [Candidatus Ichthyocystis sparus]
MYPVASGVSSSGVALESGTNKVGVVLDVDLKQIESSSVTTSTIADRGGANSRGGAIAQKPGTSTVVSPSVVTSITTSQRYDTVRLSRKHRMKKLGDVSCEDFARAIDSVGAPIVAFSIKNDTSKRSRKRVIKSETSESSSSKCAIETTESANSAIGIAHSSAISSPQLQLELSSQHEPVPNLHIQSDAKSSSSSTTIVSTIATNIVSTAATTIVSTAAAIGKGMVSAGGKGKAPVPKRGTSVAVFSSVVATGEVVDVGRDIVMISAQKPVAAAPDCDSLCAMVLPERALMIKDLFSKVDALARSIYEAVMRKQFPSEISDKLPLTERAIWYWNYKATCEVSFVSRCFGEYHAEHRPGFVNSLSKIQVLSDDKGSLLDFLLGLDCAICREVRSVFNSCWSEMSVPLEEGLSRAISCKDFVNVLDIAGIPSLLLSANIESKIRGIGSKDKGAVSVTSVIDLTHSSPPSTQLLPSQSDNGSGNVSASIEDRTLTASTIPISSSRVSLSVQCVDLLGVRLHPDSAKLVYDLFSIIRISARKSCLTILNCLLRTMGSALSIVGKAIWCRTYMELFLLNFMTRYLCLYHCKYRSDFIHSLADLRVFSSSCGGLVPLSGGVLLGFLSKLDCAVSEELRFIFNSQWGEVANKVFAELEDRSLSNVSCEDCINIIDVAGVPGISHSISQKYEKYQRRLINKSKKLIRGSKCTVVSTKSVPPKRVIGRSKTSGSSGSTESVILSTVSTKPCSVSVTDTLSTAAVSPAVIAFSSSLVAGDAVVPTVSGNFSDSDVLSLLGVVLSPDSAPVIEDLFSKIDVFARSTYKRMVRKQLTSDASNRLTVTGKAIWYFTYRLMCEYSFVSRCIGDYHSRYRPGFIHALPSIKVLSGSSDRSVVTLTGDRLSDFLSRLDCAVHGRVKSIFNSNWSEVSVTLEKESLAAVGCKDFVNVLEIAGIPQLASSAMSESIKRARFKGHAVSVEDYIGVSSSDSIVAKRHKSSDGASITTYNETGVVTSAVGIPPISSEESTLTSPTTISSPSSCVSLPVHCVDLLCFKLHPDSAELICNILHGIRKFARMSFSKSMLDHIVKILSSELSVLGKSIWFKTYGELHLSRFMHRFLCVYHYKHYPSFVRVLGSIRVLSSATDPRLVPLSGARLLDFLSGLDCAIREEVKSIFILEWDRLAGSVFSELEEGSFSTASSEDFIRVLDVVGVPPAALTVSQRYDKRGCVRRKRAIGKRKTLGSSSKCTGGTVSGRGTVSVAHSSAISLPQLQSQGELSSQLQPQSGSSLTLATRSVDVPTVVSDQSSDVSMSDIFSAAVSGLDADASSSSTDLLVLSREVGLTSEIIVSESEVLVSESTSASSSEQVIVPITVPSSVSAAIEEFPTVASSSYYRGPKKLFMMRSVKGAFEAPTSSDVTAGTSSSVPVDVDNVSLVSAATDTVDGEGNLGARLAALLNRGLPPSPPLADEQSGSIRGGRVGGYSSHSGSARRGSGRERKS